MRTLVAIFIPLAMFHNNMDAFQWQRQRTGTSVSIQSVFFVTSTEGWAVGDSGTIIHTMDSGQQWQKQASGVTRLLTKVFFVDSLYGWVVGTTGTFLHTTDGGNTWTKVTGTNNRPLADVRFVSRDVGWVVGGQQLSNGPYGVILGTTDGGRSWNMLVDSTAGVFQGCYFLNESQGWVVGGKTYFDNFSPDIVLHTKNGGVTWEEQITPTDGPLRSVVFLNGNLGWAGGSSTMGETVLLKTANGGATWQTIYFQHGPIVDNSPILSLSLLDSLGIWAIRYGDVNYSSNGGVSWTEANPDSGALTSGVFFLNPSTGWLTGSKGAIWKYGIPSDIVLQSQSYPPAFELQQNFPNPFNPRTEMQFSLSRNDHVRLSVHDLLGRELGILVDDFQSVGSHKISFDGSAFPSGVYYYRLNYSGSSQAKKMVLIK